MQTLFQLKLASQGMRISLALLFLCLLPVVALASVRISQLNDLAFGTVNEFTGNLQAIDQLCIYNSESISYIITASGNNGPLELTNEHGSKLPYNVCWSTAPGSGSPGLNLSANSAQSFDGANTVSSDCGGGLNLNAEVRVTILETDLQNAVAGNYQGALQLFLSPAS